MAGTERYSGRYIIGNVAVPEEDRDRFRSLTRTDTYRNLKVREPEVGEEGCYCVDLTPGEAARVEADPPKNMRYVERDGRMKPHVDASVPSDSDLADHRSKNLYEWGFTGAGIDVGVIDDGIGSGCLAKFNVKANQSFFSGTTDADHGSPCASLAVPREARLVFGAVGEEYYTSDSAAAMNWMVDTVGVHVISMSYGGNSPYQAFADAIANALAKGVELFASAGNDNSSTPQYPGYYDGVTCVGALDKTNGWRKASFSNYGDWVDKWVNGVNLAAYDANGNSTLFSGTSAATPLAAFVHASLLTKGLTSIGQIGTRKAIEESGPRQESRPPSGSGPGIGPGRRINGEAGAYAMRNHCP